MLEIQEAIEKAHKPGFINGMYIFTKLELIELVSLVAEKEKEVMIQSAIDAGICCANDNGCSQCKEFKATHLVA